MNLKSEQTNQKLRGGYYTPKKLTDYLTSWIFEGDKNGISIFEPSAGDGAFLKSILNRTNSCKVTAVEIDAGEYKKAQALVSKDKRFDIANQDFFDFYEKNQNTYHAIIGNPPYIRYQFLEQQQRITQSDILEKNGMKANRLINSWVAFTVATVELLKPSGKLAFVLPTDILQVTYARQLREFLFKELSEITLITFEVSPFENIQQDIVLLMGVKKRASLEVSKFRVINLKSMQHLKSCYNEKYYTVEGKKDKKWTRYLLGYKQTEAIENLYKSKDCIALNDIAKVEVGITTGKNELFCVTEALIEKYDLSNFKRPLLGRSINSHGIVYGKNDLYKNIKSKKKAWLLDFNSDVRENFSKGAINYLSLIEQKGLNSGYKLGIRNEWYNVPSIWIPDAFMLRRIGSFPKLILNKIGAVSTDTFHRMKFNHHVDEHWIIFSLYSSIGLLSFELAGRSFGGGALEILPGDIDEILVPKKLDSSLDSIKLFLTLDDLFRKNTDILEIISFVDTVLINQGTVSAKEIEKYRNIYFHLLKRRLKKK